MLETLGQTNIGSLNLAEPQEEIRTFDLDRDVTEQDWVGMHEQLNRDRGGIGVTHDGHRYFLDMAASMKLLDPVRSSEINVPENLWDATQTKLRTIKDNLVTGYRGLLGIAGVEEVELLRTTGAVAVVMPERKPEIEESYRVYWEYVFDKLHANRKVLLSDIFELALIFPERTLPLVRSSQILKEIVTREAEVSLSFHSEPKFRLGLKDAFFLAAKLRLVYPDEGLEISQVVWKEMRKYLQKTREERVWFNFVDTAFASKVLAADKAQFNEDGTIEIAAPSQKVSLIQAVPDLPETRKF
ncbi:MAG: hypothetical protein Q7R49_01790 [Candidatus Daviesbacteria bacterium]|nr:hypothetical protein [Candidatus Daviesbacteria bacterium]